MRPRSGGQASVGEKSGPIGPAPVQMPVKASICLLALQCRLTVYSVFAPLSFHASGLARHEAEIRIFKKLEASAGFEPAVEVLQTSALPLG